VDVPERQALETILRSVSGYLAAPRTATITTASRFDRILILPTSAAPPAGAGGPAQRPGRAVQPFTPPPVDTDVVEEPEVQEEPDVQGTPFVPQRPGEGEMPTPMQPGFVRRADGSVQPVYPVPGQEAQEQAPAGPQPIPGAPTTSARPGEIVVPPAPQGQPPGTPVYPGRPVPQQPPPD
jgi:hypothetical protein